MSVDGRAGEGTSDDGCVVVMSETRTCGSGDDCTDVEDGPGGRGSDCMAVEAADDSDTIAGIYFVITQLTDLTTTSADISLRGSQIHGKCDIHGGHHGRRVGVKSKQCSSLNSVYFFEIRQEGGDCAARGVSSTTSTRTRETRLRRCDFMERILDDSTRSIYSLLDVGIFVGLKTATDVNSVTQTSASTGFVARDDPNVLTAGPSEVAAASNPDDADDDSARVEATGTNSSFWAGGGWDNATDVDFEVLHGVTLNIATTDAMTSVVMVAGAGPGHPSLITRTKFESPQSRVFMVGVEEDGLGSIPFPRIGTDLQAYLWIVSLVITFLQFLQLILPLFGVSLFRFAPRWPRNPKKRAREQEFADFERRCEILHSMVPHGPVATLLFLIFLILSCGHLAESFDTVVFIGVLYLLFWFNCVFFTRGNLVEEPRVRSYAFLPQRKIKYNSLRWKLKMPTKETLYIKLTLLQETPTVIKLQQVTASPHSADARVAVNSSKITLEIISLDAVMLASAQPDVYPAVEPGALSYPMLCHALGPGSPARQGAVHE